MKWLGLIAMALVMESCLYNPMYKQPENLWAFFEDWDEDKSSSISMDEFTKGYHEDDMMKKVSLKSKYLTYEEFNRFIQEWERKSERQSGEKTAEEAAKRDLSSFDLNGDQKLTEEEIAQAMFGIADENHDNSLTSLEFYHWEVYL